MGEPLTGVQKWIYGVRSRMANDPGRQDLYDTIFCNGFLFLTEYIDDIREGAQAEPIIELTKTPGRRKDAAREAKSVWSNNLRGRAHQSSNKENVPFGGSPIQPSPSKGSHKFYQALLQAGKENRDQDVQMLPEKAIEPAKPKLDAIFEERFERGNIERREECDVENLVTPPYSFTQWTDHPSHPPASDRGVKVLNNGPSRNHELPGPLSNSEKKSEGAASNRSSNLPPPVIPDKHTPFYAPKGPKGPGYPAGPMVTTTDNEDERSFNDSEPTSTASSFPIDPYARDYETHELPAITPEQIAHAEHAQQPEDSMTTNFTRKASIPVFPSLPPPSPFRKSIRDPFTVNQILTNVPNPAAAGGKRTSWLHKARDLTGKMGPTVSAKRKSDEMDNGQAEEAFERASKVFKTNVQEEVSHGLVEKHRHVEKQAIPPFRPVVKPKDQTQTLPVDVNSEGMISMLKRTVDGLGARVGKSFGKSLGGAAAAAEAKAAAEARLAQRDAKGSDPTRQPRLTVSDLVANFEGAPSGMTPLPEQTKVPLSAESPMEITPINSPSTITVSASVTDLGPSIPKFQIQRSNQPIQRVSSVSVNYSQPMSQPSQSSQPSTQSTNVSNIFDHDEATWTQSSVNTDYTTNTQGFTQNQSQMFGDPKFTKEHITPFTSYVVKNSAAEISTVDPPQTTLEAIPKLLPEPSMVSVPAFHTLKPYNSEQDIGDIHEDTMDLFSSKRYSLSDESDNQTVGSSQQSGPSSQPTAGPSATKRGKEPVKSIQLAAIAAKKQQEELSKKAARLEKMEQRRLQIASKNAAKRDKEDILDRTITQPLPKINKLEDDTTKKKKVVGEEKKQPLVMKKPPSKDKSVLRTVKPTTPGLPVPAPQLNFNAPAQTKSSMLSSSIGQPTIKLVGNNEAEGKFGDGLPKPATSQVTSKEVFEDIRQPSRTLQAQMQARVQAQMLQVNTEPPPVPSESIDLPEIASEYSDSEDEGRPKTFEPPAWAKSPVLTQALQSQSRLNPDDIFGPVKPLKMGEIFNTRESRFRARSSSANWVGTDELTELERVNYAKRMGYIKE